MPVGGTWDGGDGIKVLSLVHPVFWPGFKFAEDRGADFFLGSSSLSADNSSQHITLDHQVFNRHKWDLVYDSHRSDGLQDHFTPSGLDLPMQVARSLAIGRSTPNLGRASSSKLRQRTPTTDRYLALHAFFTRQAHSYSHSLTPSRSQALACPAWTPRASVRTALYQSRRHNSSSPSTRDADGKACPNCPPPSSHPSSPPPVAQRGHAQEYTPFIQRLIHRTQSLTPNSPHRPTKEELLAAASSKWERFRIRMKWFFIRGWRRFNTDDFSAFASWFVLGNSEYRSAGRADEAEGEWNRAHQQRCGS
jgi:hypothetical protein